MKAFFRHHDISLNPLLEDLSLSSRASLRGDLIAGFYVAMLTLPQVMAYALTAGLPLSSGIFGAVFATILAALLGSSKHLVVGPTNTIAILVQTGTAQILYTQYRDISEPMRELISLQIVTQLTLMVGIFQILAAVAGLGKLTQFVSYSVVIAYMIGTAIALVINQLFVVFGIALPEAPMSICEKVAYLLTHLHTTHQLTLVLGGGCLVFLLLARRYASKLPASAIMLALTGTIFFCLRHYQDSFAFDSLVNVQLVGDAGTVEGLVPQWVSLKFDMGLLNSLFPIALAIALLGMLEASAVGKAAAVKSGQQLSVNQEVFGLGWGNLAAAFFGGMPSSGSPSRSAMNYDNGGKSRFAAMFSGLFVALIVVAFGHIISFIPLFAFAAMLVVTAFGLIDARHFLLCLRSNIADAFVLVTTLVACLIFSVDIAFFIGIGLSITFYLNKAATPYLVEHLVSDAGDLRGTELPGTTRDKEIRIISVQGELFFGAADLFQSTLKTLAAGDQRTRVLILRLKHARDVDATACLALQHLNRYLKESGRYLVGCSITQPVWQVLQDSGVAEEIGLENLFLFDSSNPQLSVKQAWQRARELAECVPHAPPVEAPLSAEVPQTS